MLSKLLRALVVGTAEEAGGYRRGAPRQTALALFMASLYSVSTGLSDSLNNAIFNNTSYVETTAYLSLHTSDPGTTGASEVAGGSYVRQACPGVASSSGTYTSDAAIDFTGMPDTTGDDIGHAGIWDASTAGNFLIAAALDAAKVTNAGDTFRVASGNLTCAFA